MLQIGGFQKLTLLDYPGKVAATLFTVGCNFRCPYCQNAALVIPGRRLTLWDSEAVLTELGRRRKLLDGVCISGGEPLLQSGLADFLCRLKDLGYSIKLDTNGSFPQRLQALVRQGLVDYVAMDIKNAPADYARTAGILPALLEALTETKDWLLSGAVDYEFRTTVVRGYHTPERLAQLGAWIAGARRYYLQNCEDSGDLIQPGLSGFSRAELETLAAAVRPLVPVVEIRGDK
ncbi:anaerobic ribonucleoside-triphosphate reductase activating protein [Oscillospiraceae bacterium HV4-5-C5C]|nr:anaerobic ribonucleoside-triphosphate reductase activating protein [Oscillospiraceae bacterium HV4-5-C5C]